MQMEEIVREIMGVKNMWQIVAAFVISFCIGMILGPLLIPALHRLKFGQSIRNDGPADSFKEAGHADDGRCNLFFHHDFGRDFLSERQHDFLVFVSLGFGVRIYRICR